MGLLNSVKNFIAPADSYEDEIERDSSVIKVVLYEPRTFADTEIVGVKIKKGNSAVVNLQRIADGDSQRTLDFLSGMLFALDGSVHKIGKSVYLFAPSGVPVDGLIEELSEKT